MFRISGNLEASLVPTLAKCSFKRLAISWGSLTFLLSKVISLIVDLLSLRFIKLLSVFQISLGFLAFDSSLV